MTTVFAGFALALSSSPYGVWPLAIVGLAILYRRTENQGRRRRAFRTWIATSIMFLFGLSWTRQYSSVGWVVLSLIEAAIYAAALLLVPKKRSWKRLVAFPAALGLAELVRIRIPWGGFPMGGFTPGVAGSPLAHGASLIGEPGMVPLFALAGAALTELVRIKGGLRKKALTAWGVVLVVPIIGAIVHTAPAGSTITVASVQGGGQQALRIGQQDPAGVLARHIDATEDIDRDVDLIVWPENVVTVRQLIDDTYADRQLARLAQAADATIIAGVVESESGRFRNAAIEWTPEGDIVDRYEKHQRVPFGEYVPGRDFIERFADLSQVPSDAYVGDSEPLLHAGEVPVGVGISYEGLFARRMTSATAAGGEVLIIPTNASSYLSGKVSAAEVAGARFRALESGRWVILSAPTGKSAIVDERGQVVEESGIGPAAVLYADAERFRGRTPYVLWGDWAILVLGGLALCAAWGTPRVWIQRVRR